MCTHEAEASAAATERAGWARLWGLGLGVHVVARRGQARAWACTLPPHNADAFVVVLHDVRAHLDRTAAHGPACARARRPPRSPPVRAPESGSTAQPGVEPQH